MTTSAQRVSYKSLLHQMTQTTPTCLWNDSAAIDELTRSIEDGAVGATCNPVIAVSVLKKEMPAWRPRIESLLRELPTATEDEIGWKLIEELSVRAAQVARTGLRGARGAQRPPLDPDRSAPLPRYRRRSSNRPWRSIASRRT